MNKILIVIVVIIALLGFYGVSAYNGLVSLNENVNGKWSQVENQLQRRADLIPNLVNTVKGYAAHEQKVFGDVAAARSKLLGAQGPEAKSQANGELTSALGRLLMISESYPQLKADANFRQLQDELAGTENRLAVARKDYNDTVQVYNTKIKSFPTSIFASMLGFSGKQYFKADEGAKAVPTVKF
ncbi:MAG: LemA family protein [Negativicutes bacterium]|jgi:LemA protein